jgi:hypothetical protein
MKHSNCCDQEIYILNEADYQYLFNCDRQPDSKLIKLFKSKSPWESEAIAEVRASFDEAFVEKEE